MAGQYPGVPSLLNDIRAWIIEAAQVINSLRNGEINTTQDVTLTANATSTTVTEPQFRPERAISFDPMTANAAAELAAGTMYVTSANRLVGSFVITHASNSQTDRTFRITVTA